MPSTTCSIASAAMVELFFWGRTARWASRTTRRGWPGASRQRKGRSSAPRAIVRARISNLRRLYVEGRNCTQIDCLGQRDLRSRRGVPHVQARHSASDDRPEDGYQSGRRARGRVAWSTIAVASPQSLHDRRTLHGFQQSERARILPPPAHAGAGGQAPAHPSSSSEALWRATRTHTVGSADAVHLLAAELTHEDRTIRAGDARPRARLSGSG